MTFILRHWSEILAWVLVFNSTFALYTQLRRDSDFYRYPAFWTFLAATTTIFFVAKEAFKAIFGGRSR